MTKLINNTGKTIDQITRIDGKWWDGLKPGDTLETDNPYVIKALVKHGVDVVGKKKRKEATPTKEAAPKKPPVKKHGEVKETPIDLSSKTVKELRELAKEKGVSVRGSKTKIIDKISQS